MKKYDFLIVGQGLAGTMLAFELLERGIDFQIISSHYKRKASIVAAGMINPLVFKRMTKSWMVHELLPEVDRRYRQLENRLGEKFLFKKNILKPLSEQESTMWIEKMHQPEFSDFIVSVSEISPLEEVAKAPAWGIVSGTGYLRLANFLEKAASLFRQSGLLLETEFDHLPPFANSFEIANRAFQNIVFCEGYHLIHNPLFDFVKMNPVKGEVVQIHAPALSEDFILNKKVFVLPVGNHRFKVGSTYEWDDLSEVPAEKGRVSILERLDNLIDVEYSVEHQQAGVRPTISDRRPVLGVHPEKKNVFIFNGLGTKGVMLAPYFSRIMADFLSGTADEIPAEANVKRFFVGK